MASKRRPKGYWNDFANLQAELQRDRRFDLKYGIERSGGTAVVAQKLGLAVQRPGPRRRRSRGNAAG